MKKHAKKLVVGLLLLAVAAAGGYYWMNRPAEAPPTAPVVREDLEDMVEEIGEIVTDNHRQVVAHLPGRIGNLEVEPGDEVNAGDLLVEIDSSDWRTALNRLEDELAAARSTYQVAMDSAHRGSQQAQAALELAEKQWEESRKQLDRVQALYDAGAVSQQELIAAQLEETNLASAVEQAALSLEASEDALSPAARGGYEAGIRQLEREREHLRTQQDSYFVEAPVGGTILARHVEAGAYVQPGELLLELGDLKQLYITADLLAREMSGVAPGMAVRVIHRDLGTDPVNGHIRKVYPTAFAKVSELGIEQRRVRIEVEVDQVDPQWRPGYEVDVEIIRETRENALTVPERAVFWLAGEEHVFVWENEEVIPRQVTTGLSTRNRTEIITGLSEGELVLTEPENQ
ncbi:efflux RND transporter periplasmic adaptor subunit [Anoxynatronum buryatiense]|uniref:HlyD family secretion protein n=1 Tax=Anoxynatronum buryatiense TaxID=489973 RepID=A0AA46AIR4_9CLOT|nr:efflux RND transporter periplasmic adaptor subunit [Anoxynatronum buryatiense]SMP52244.1 HlyD family secretion protein [Anoxynatronum buryatiense]